MNIPIRDSPFVNVESELMVMAPSNDDLVLTEKPEIVEIVSMMFPCES